MPGLRQRDGDGPLSCAECEQREPVGPCAACEAMICADCGVMTKDPNGQKVICASCANLVADVSSRKLERRSRSSVGIAVALLVVVALGVAAVLLSGSCFSPEIPTGLVCGEMRQCPEGQFCDLPSGTCVTEAPAADAQPGSTDALPGSPDSGAPDAAPGLCAGGDAAVEGTDGHCYIYFSNEVPWQTAVETCAALPGAPHLVTITDGTEYDVVAQLVANDEVWVGATDVAMEDTFVWITGEPFSFESFGLGEPNDGGFLGDEDCVEVRGISHPVALTWNDDDCTKSEAYVCEREP